jgi:hypothetical protein
MSSVGQFPVQYTDIDECPVHFRAPLNRVIDATDTLLVELTDILLYGQLKIHYAFNDQSTSSECNFNTVFEDMYTKAIQRVLNLIDDERGTPIKSSSATGKQL